MLYYLGAVCRRQKAHVLEFAANILTFLPSQPCNRTLNFPVQSKM